MLCPHCGNDNPHPGTVCAYCGVPLPSATPPAPTLRPPSTSFNAVPPPPPGRAYDALDPSYGADYQASPLGERQLIDAGLGMRFLAMLIDVLILGFIGCVVGGVVGGIVGLPLGILSGVFQAGGNKHLADFFSGLGGLISLGVYVVIWWLYFAILESSSAMATPGKQALGMLVTDINGQRINFSQASIRFFGKFLSSCMCGIGWLFPAFTLRQQALHDQLAGTYVMMR